MELNKVSHLLTVNGKTSFKEGISLLFNLYFNYFLFNNLFRNREATMFESNYLYEVKYDIIKSIKIPLRRRTAYMYKSEYKYKPCLKELFLKIYVSKLKVI